MTTYNEFCVEKCGNKDEFFLFDTALAGEILKNTWTLDSAGYLCRNASGRVERMHTVVVECYMGCKLADGMYVDHINKCKRDNRICNLRVVSPQDSAKNMPLRANNTTGVAGVSLGRGGKGYRSYITVDKRRIELGTYKTLHEAAMARYAAEERYGFKHQQSLNAFLIELEEKHENRDSENQG